MGEQAVRERIAGCSSWAVQRQLGRGQYGTAYLVEWSGEAGGPEPGDLAVAKVVGLEFLPEKEHNLAHQEVELMRKLRHPNIVSLKDHFLTEAGLELVIVMDFCDSGDLRGEVKRRAAAKPPSFIAEAQIMRWFYQLTIALNYVHQRHILHRDLKSSNIFLNAETNGSHDVKIGDFGIARVLEGTVDVAATVVGTPYYMSPEVCRSEPYGYKSDIWALGCVLYEMCMLKHAFESQSLLGLVYKIVSETYDPIPDQYTGDLRALLDRILDKSSHTRINGKDLVADPYVKRFAKDGSVAEPGGTLTLGRGDLTPIPEAAPGLASTRRMNQADVQPVQPQKPPPPRTNSLQPSRSRPPRSSPSLQGPARGIEAAPPPPEAVHLVGGRPLVQEEPVRRQWCGQPAMAPSVGGAHQLDESELRPQVLLRRIHLALAKRRQNWLQVFASFDRAGNGQLREAEFEQAVTSLALGLSDGEIREVRAHLQGGGSCVPVDRFGAALHNSSQEVLRLEEWGRSVFADLTREAAKAGAGSGGGVAPGAHVQVQGLQSAVGQKLNGSEGVVEKWDSTACRWVIRLSNGTMKSIRDEHLHVTRPASGPTAPSSPRAAGMPDTKSLYRLLCEGGETAVPEERFLAVVRRLLPRVSETELRKLLLLLPKSQDGRVDAEEVLAQFVTNSAAADQTIRMAGPRISTSPFSPGAARRPGTSGMIGPSPPRPSPGAPRIHTPGPMPSGGPGSAKPTMTPGAVPGAVSSPRAGHAPPSPVVLGAHAGGSSSSTAPGFAPTAAAPGEAGEDRVRAEVALLRLAQRLMTGGRASVPGPGLEVLRLFSARPDEITLDELLAAASVLPLGISRAEAQSIFANIYNSGTATGTPASLVSTDAVPFTRLFAAAEAALAAGVPAEASSLERLDVSRLTAALNRLSNIAGGRASPQDFRFSMMQAEPYLTPIQLEWLMMLTDKDGEGRLLPRSLLARLNPSLAARGFGGRGGGTATAHVLVPPRPVGASDGEPVAKNLPRAVVVAAALTRMRDRLSIGSSRLALERVVGLFDIDVQEQLSRGAAANLLRQLRLGISAEEADEVVNFLPGTGTGGAGSVQLSNIYEAILRASDPEVEALVSEMREAARSLLVGRGELLAAAIFSSTDGSDWIPEADFRRALCSVMTADGGHAESDMEDRLVLLAEKDASGDVRWRPFVNAYAGWEEADSWSESGVLSPVSAGLGTRRGFGAATLKQPEANTTAQSWRSTKTPQAGVRMVVTVSPEKSLREQREMTVSETPEKRCGCVIA